MNPHPAPAADARKYTVNALAHALLNLPEEQQEWTVVVCVGTQDTHEFTIEQGEAWVAEAGCDEDVIVLEGDAV